MANGGQEPTGIFVAPTPAQITAISFALPVAVADIQNKLAPLFSRVRASSVNIITEKFAANGQGIDLLFDMVAITVTNGSASMVNKADGGIILPLTSMAGGVLSASPDVNMMSSIFTITGRGRATAKNKAPPYPQTPIMIPSTDAQSNYTFFLPNGAYEVSGNSGLAFSHIEVIVNNADVKGPDFLF